MNDTEYLNWLKTLINSRKNFSSNLANSEKLRPLKQWILNKTSNLFSIDDKKCTLGTRIYYIVNNLTEYPRCANPKCNKEIKYKKFGAFDSIESYYHCHCSLRCVHLDPVVYEKIKQTTLKLYGCERGNIKPETVYKRKATMIERYGADQTMKVKELADKVHHTNLNRYGCEHAFQNEEIRNKIKKTNIERYGVETPLESSEIQQKIKETFIEKYGTSNLMEIEQIKEKIKETNKRKYGSEWYLGTEQCINDTKKFFNEVYGVDHPSQVKEMQDKKEKTNIERYGNRAGKTFNNDEVKRTMLEKYGVEHSSHSIEIRKKAQYRYTYNNILFDSKPEIALYIYLVDHNIKFEYQPNIKFEYEYNGKIHYYMPDFYINGEYVEIKGDHFFKNGKMVCPFRNKNWSEETYNQICGLYESKYKCMIKNNIKILRSNDYKKYFDYVKEKYGSDYLKQFKNHV